MKLDLRPLLAEDIRVLAVNFTLPAPLDRQNDPSSPLYGVSFPAPLTVTGEITNTAGYMRMTLSATIPYCVACARCLCDVDGSFTFLLEKTVTPAGLLHNIREEDADDYVVVEDGFLDVDEQLLEVLELDFPSKVLCRPDCAGICPKCGKDLNEGACSCTEKEIDPRLAPLAAILERMREDEPKDE